MVQGGGRKGGKGCDTRRMGARQVPSFMPSAAAGVGGGDGHAPSVLHRVVGSTRKALGDLGPPRAELRVHLEDGLILLRRPSPLFQRRIQVVAPPLAALLAGTAGQQRCDARPVLAAILLDELDELSVLGGAPRSCSRKRTHTMIRNAFNGSAMRGRRQHAEPPARASRQYGQLK